VSEVLDVGQELAPWRALRIAMIGQKGLPATFGGIEHHVEQIGQRLAARGHHVTVYSRKSYSEQGNGRYRGMDLRTAPTIPSKHLDAIVHSATSTAAAVASGCDIIHYHALGPGLVAPVAKAASRAAIVQTIHGLDHERDKWGTAASAVLKAAYWMSGHVPDRTVVVSRTLQDHYFDTFARASTYIANGVTQQPAVSDALVCEQYGLVPGEYLLSVGRLVPEKGLDLLLKAYRSVPGDRKLVIVGDSSFSDDYARHLRDLATEDPRVLFTGYLYGDTLAAMYQNAGLFLLPSLLEGLPLTLLEALGSGLPVVASDIGPNTEVLGMRSGPGRHLFQTGNEESLSKVLTAAVVGGETDSAAIRAFHDDVLARYSWDGATLALESVYLDALHTRSGGRRPQQAATSTARR
jgi:glycosyltransferase involved in cell wall biosynthesis